MRRAAASLGALLAFFIAAPSAAALRAQQVDDHTVPKAWILVDADSGAVLAGQQVHQPLLPASTVKVMTAITAVEVLPVDAQLRVSANAAQREPMKIDMREGETWPFRVALQSMLMVSANDAAYAIAENAGGSLDGFAQQMQETGTRLGMRDSTFSDPAGLDDAVSFRGGSRMSAFDLAIAARNLLSVPELAEIVGTKKAGFVDPRNSQRTLTNHVRFLSTYSGATGIKTGYTKQAGRTLVASATRNGRTMIAVVLDVIDHYGFAAQLLDQGFSTASRSTGTGERLPRTAVVVGRGVDNGVPARAGTATPAAIAHTNQDVPWGYVLGGTCVLVVMVVIWRRHAVRSRRRALAARQRRIDAARARSVRAAIDLGDDPRGGILRR